MRAVGLSDIAAAARALMRVPEADRPALMQALIDEAHRADRFRARFGRVHPRSGNGTLMAAALAHAQAEVAGPGDGAYLAALAQAIDGVLEWRHAQQTR